MRSPTTENRDPNARAGPRARIAAVLTGVALWACGAPPIERIPQPNILIYLVDTLRAESLGCYGHLPSLSPEIDAFADEATLFENTLAQSAWTRAAVASVLTGMMPDAHGVVGRDDALSERAATLAELLRAQGYRTGGFITNGNAGGNLGFGQGFDVYELLGERDGAQLHHLSDDVNAAAFDWVDGGGTPFFLYLHTMDPHAPYAPPAPFRERHAANATTPPLSPEEHRALLEIRELLPARFGPEVTAIELGSMLWVNGLSRGKLRVTPERTRSLESLYEAEIAFNDHSFGALLDGLRERGLYDDTLIVFVSDHGEEFYEHDRYGHGTQLFSESVKVPLIVRFPRQRRGERRGAPEIARQIDVVPTIVDYLGLEPPAGLDGRSLLAEASGDGDARRAISIVELDGNEVAAIVDWPYKLIRRTRPQARTQLFDLANDPREQQDLYREDSPIATRLLADLAAHRARTRGIDPDVATLDEATAEKLEALGYAR